ncbi:hypothetical protein B7494_g748 [Chlorociboria aeruginascens]|nr:hypothetical protein B7494_g748 [Chlorociboria aeruginascens]
MRLVPSRLPQQPSHGLGRLSLRLPTLLRSRATITKGFKQRCGIVACLCLRRYGSLSMADTTDDEKSDSKMQFVTIPPHITEIPPLKIVRRQERRFLPDKYGPWKESLWTMDQIEFESNLCPVHFGLQNRLLDSTRHKDDMNLWACLLDYRRRRYGLVGVSMFFEAICRRDVKLPVSGSLAAEFWTTLLDLGFEDVKLLEQVCDYADKLHDSTGERWSKLYISIVQHFLLQREGNRAIAWHNRLIEGHPPTPRAFANLCRQVIVWGGDMAALQRIYTLSSYRNIYSEVMKVLCRQKNYEAALDWHWLLVRKGDLPFSAKLWGP